MKRYWLSFVTAAFTQACAGDAVVQNATQTDPEVASVDTLVLGVHVRIAGAVGSILEPFDGFALAGSQVTAVTLRVDDASWGTFTPTLTAAPADAIDVQGWRALDRESPATVVAMLGAATSSDEPEPATVEDWVGVLNKRLLAGGHLVEIEEVTLTNAAGGTITLAPRMLVPIRVESGDRTAVVEVELRASDLGGAL